MLSSPPPAPSLGSEHHHRVTSPSDLSASAVIPSIGQFGSDLSATFHVSESVHDQHLHSHSQHRSQFHHQHHHNRLQSFAVDGNGEGQSPIPNVSSPMGTSTPSTIVGTSNNSTVQQIVVTSTTSSSSSSSSSLSLSSSSSSSLSSLSALSCSSNCSSSSSLSSLSSLSLENQPNSSTMKRSPPPPPPAPQSSSSTSSGSSPVSATTAVTSSTTTTTITTNHTTCTTTSPFICIACHQPILDRYLACISPECYWHEQCLQCAVCRILLTRSCYVKERKLYCKHDYNKLYAVKCTNCTEPIGPHELVMRVQNYIFHVACFTCIRCGRQLQKGDEYSLRSGRLICRLDLETEGFLPYHPLQHRDVHSPLRPVIPMSPGIDMITSNGQTPLISDGGAMDPYSPRANNGSNCDSMINGTNGGGGLLVKGEPYSPQAGVVVSQQTISNGQHGGPQQQQQPQPGTPAQGPPITVKQDGRRGPKRPRTILTTAQRRAFKASFEISQKPCRKVRETLAKETGLSVRIVQVWFQNQRAKLKKMQRKQQQQAMVHGNNGGQGGGLLMGNGSESGGGMGSHSSDKSKDDSTDEEDDDGSTAAFSIPSMQGYMIHSPDEGAYYSREDDSGGYLTKGNELTTLDDSETSLCELDNDGSIIRPGSNDGIHSHHLSMHGSSMELTCLTSNGPIFHSPPPPPTHAQHHHSHPMMSHLGPMIPTGATLVPTSTQAAIPTGTGSSMTPIDKLYSMQNSYFNNPSECEC